MVFLIPPLSCVNKQFTIICCFHSNFGTVMCEFIGITSVITKDLCVYLINERFGISTLTAVKCLTSFSTQKGSFMLLKAKSRSNSSQIRQVDTKFWYFTAVLTLDS